MSAPVSVRRLAAHEWPLLRALRLGALADAPDAFARTLAEEQRFSDAEWASRLAAAAGSSAQLSAVAERGGRAVALVYARLADGAPEQAHLYSMWVEPSARRAGVGRALVEAASAWARAAGARRLVLQVAQGNAGARRLYESLGFEGTGETAPLREGSPLLVETLRRAL